MERGRDEWIRESWALLGDGADALGPGIYARWLAADPGAARAFAGIDVDRHAHRVGQALGDIVAALDDPRAVVRHVITVAAEHCDLGLSERAYADFGHALLGALADRLGPAFHPSARAAWEEEYRLLAALVRRVAGRAALRDAPPHEPGRSP